MHIRTGDTFMLGIGWLSKKLYGEGGLEIYLGFLIICFWEKPEIY
jgi:hypothetical protein